MLSAIGSIIFIGTWGLLTYAYWVEVMAPEKK